MKTVILAAGTFPKTSHALAHLAQADFIACCDGATHACLAAGYEPQLIVGDGDSLGEEQKARFADRFVHTLDQEHNDLTKTFRHCLALGHRDITILGATGKREDHAMGNIALLMDYALELPTVTMVSDYGTFYPATDLLRLHVRVGQEVSIFNFGATYFSGVGLEYPLYDFDRLWQGTLNKALRPDIAIHAHGRFLVYVAEED